MSTLASLLRFRLRLSLSLVALGSAVLPGFFFFFWFWFWFLLACGAAECGETLRVLVGGGGKLCFREGCDTGGLGPPCRQSCPTLSRFRHFVFFFFFFPVSL